MFQEVSKGVGKAGQGRSSSRQANMRFQAVAKSGSLIPQGTRECKFSWRPVNWTFKLSHPISHLLKKREEGRIKAILVAWGPSSSEEPQVLVIRSKQQPREGWDVRVRDLRGSGRRKNNNSVYYRVWVFSPPFRKAGLEPLLCHLPDQMEQYNESLLKLKC